MTYITLRWELKARRTRSGPIKWFDGQGNHPLTAKAMGMKYPAGWNKTVEAVVAHHSSVHVALARAAAELHQAAARRLADHRDTGASRIGIERGDYLDWHVFLEDRGAKGRESALSIEFGHRTRSGGRVGGLFVLTGAVSGMASTPDRRWDK